MTASTTGNSLQFGDVPATGADRTPDEVCIVEGTRGALTWKRWNDCASSLAATLIAHGVRRGDSLASQTRPCLEWWIFAAAAAKIGARTIPISEKLTTTESLHILRDCGASGVLVTDGQAGALADGWRPLGLKLVVAIRGGEGCPPGTIGWDQALATAPNHSLVADGVPSLGIYTSGTTGAPKGAVLPPPPADPADLQRLQEYTYSTGFDGSRYRTPLVYLVTTPVTHGLGARTSFQALARGGSVIVLGRFDAEQALDLIERHRVTTWLAVPTMMSRIMNLPASVRDRYDVSSLRHLESMGGPLSAHLKSEVIDFFGECLYESYGATECGLLTGITPADQRRKARSVGRPFRHVDLRIVDDDLVEVAAGELGEIIVKTPVVIDEYIGRGPMGNDKRTPDGYYRTGDVGAVDHEGFLYIHDRKIDMIVAGGENIYPAEIEAVLAQHPAVCLSAVIGIPDADYGEQPMAFVELRPDATATQDQLMEHLAGALAKYKRPRAVEIVDRLPLNAVGKVVKRELREPFWVGRDRRV